MDPRFRNMCDKTEFSRQREWLNGLWTVFQPYADRHFPGEIRKAFQQRFWEMYLACGLLDNGFFLKENAGYGPDLHLKIDSNSYWLECVVPEAGEGGNTVPEMGSGRLRVPECEILLRYTSAIDAKQKKYEKYLSQKVVAPGDPYIIAINGASIPFAHQEQSLPRIVKALYGIGDQYVSINPKAGGIFEEGHCIQPERQKMSGARISTTGFLDARYEGVSAVLFSLADPWNLPARFGSDFILVHNAFAKNPLPLGWLGFGREYWVSGMKVEVQCKDWEEDGTS